MRRFAFGSIMAGVLAALTAVALVVPAAAQTPGGGQGAGPGGRGFQGDLPVRGGWGLMLMEQDMSRDQLMLQLRDGDCEPQSLAWFANGGWSTFVAGAPAWVNAQFPSTMRQGGIYAVSCANHNPPALRLTNTSDAGTFTVSTGDTVRIALDANPSTGSGWAVSAAPNAAVLTASGTPFFVPSVGTNAVVEGHTVFDFDAVGAGTTQIGMQYGPSGGTATQTWSVTITVN